MAYNLAKSRAKLVRKDEKHSGKLDTQLFPECAGTSQDRDVVKKETRRKHHSASSVTVGVLRKAGSAMGLVQLLASIGEIEAYAGDAYGMVRRGIDAHGDAATTDHLSAAEWQKVCLYLGLITERVDRIREEGA